MLEWLKHLIQGIAHQTPARRVAVLHGAMQQAKVAADILATPEVMSILPPQAQAAILGVSTVAKAVEELHGMVSQAHVEAGNAPVVVPTQGTQVTAQDAQPLLDAAAAVQADLTQKLAASTAAHVDLTQKLSTAEAMVQTLTDKVVAIEANAKVMVEAAANGTLPIKTDEAPVVAPPAPAAGA